MFSYRISAIAMLAVFGLMVGTVCADAVSVGNSALIGELDYSDTFTLNANRVDGTVISGVGAQVENCYDNPARSWPATNFGYFKTDASVSTVTGIVWPGGSGAGSATGMIESVGKQSKNFGFAYDLRTVFTVQYDVVYNPQADRYNITINTAPNGLAGANGLSIFFRKPGEPHGYPEIGLYNPGVGEKNLGFTPNIDDGWHNIAATFDLENGLLDIYVDENNLGQIDLTTFENGAFWSRITAASNDYINLGWETLNAAYTGTPAFWMDNVQIGAPGVIPEPSTLALFATGLIGLLAYAWRKRR